MPSKAESIDNVIYRVSSASKLIERTESVRVIGLDTEAYPSGKPFMVATSLGDCYKMKAYPRCFFSRRYIGKTFVAFNLKYDMGALLRHLPARQLEALRKHDKVEWRGYRYRVIANKMLRVSKGSHGFTCYDMLNFYSSSLDLAAERYLGERKQDLDPKLFTPEYVRQNWQQIAAYCVQDAVLVQRLAERLIKRFESFGVYPQKLFSTAYVSFQYFRIKCRYVTVKKYWYRHKEVLDYALRAYAGGKFEVTRKGMGNYYEYDIVSAYPFEIATLVDISKARVVKDTRYCASAVYSFLACTVEVPDHLNSPVAIPHRKLNIFPVGTFDVVLSKREYEYLTAHGADVTVRSAYHLMVSSKIYPYRDEIRHLVKRKQEIKRSGDELDYHTIKILLNSLYGKMCQLIKAGDKWRASTSWNPIYAAVITANCRVRVTELQQQYPSIVAVHTDSVISTEPLPYQATDKLGAFGYETKGDGVILGSGIYQIGDKVCFRGWETKRDLYTLFTRKSKRVRIDVTRPHTWREVAFHGWDPELINRFEKVPRTLDVRFDHKRLWLKDWKTFSEVPERNIESLPKVYPELFF